MNQKNKIVLTSFLICFSLLLVSFSAMAAIQLGTETITFTQPISIGTPTLSAHATTKSYVDSIVSKWKELQTVSPGSGTEWVKVATLGASTDSEVAVRITGGRDYGRAVNVEHWLMVSKRTDVIGIDYWANGDYSNEFDEIDIYVYRDTSTTPDTAYVYVRKNPYNFPLIQIYGKHSATINLQDNAPAPTIEQYWHNKTNGPTTSHANGGLNIPRLKVSGDALVSGNLGIGNTAPGYKLDVSGTGRFTGAVVVATPTASNHATTKSYVDGLVTGASSKWTTSGTKTYLTTTTNNVGIGTTAPGYKLDVSGTLRSSGEIISTSANAFRAISGNYGSIIRNDGSSTYLLLTASADQYGSWNTLRPFVVNNSTGSVNLGNGSLFVNHGGNVGVGNTSPAYKLTVNGTIGTPDMNNPYLVLDSSGSGGNAAEQSAQISLGEGGRGSASLHLAYTGDGYSYIGMGTLSGNIPTYYAMRMNYQTSNIYFPGSVGIGQTSPAYKLDVSGTGRFTGAVVVATPTASNHATTKAYVDGLVTGASSKWTTSGTNTYLTTTTNNVGIGTTTPGGILHIKRTGNSIVSIDGGDTNSTPMLMIGESGMYGVGFKWDAGSELEINKIWNSDIFSTTPTQLGAINASTGVFYWTGGNVGIGTVSPASKLNISETTGIVYGANQGSIIIDHENNGGASSIVFRSKTNRGSDYGYIQYQDDSIIGGTGEAARLFIGTYNDAVDHIILWPSGSVGIGNTAPSYKLDVAGTGRFTGAVIVGAPSEATHAATKGYVDSAAGVSVTLRDVASGTTGNAVCTANSSVCLDVVVAAAPYPSLSYSCLWTNTGDALKARCLK